MAHMKLTTPMQFEFRRVFRQAVFAAALGFVGVGPLPPLVAGLGDGAEKNPDPELSPAPHEQIDRFVEAKLKEQGLSPNRAIDDATFVRRVYLNIGGRIPTIGEIEAFHADSYPNKRERLIESLMGSEAYVSNAYHFWADLLRINGDLDSSVEAAYSLWVKNALRKNLPYDEMVRALVSAQGEYWDNGATGYYFRDRGMPLDNMSNTVRLFLGTRLECAQCHDHPFDKWTQMDYYHMAAFSYGMGSRGRNSDNRRIVDSMLREQRMEAFRSAVGIEGFPNLAPDKIRRFVGNPRKTAWLEKQGLSEQQFLKLVEKGRAATEEIDARAESMKAVVKQLYNPLKYASVYENERAQVKLPHDYQYSDAEPLSPVMARTMFGAEISQQQVEEQGVKAYADWMTSPENPTFTRVIVNRLWKEVFGLGIIEPVDELTDQTVPSHPELLAYLEELMRELDYDMQAFQSVLYKTRTYQRAADAEEIVLGMPYYFPGPILRRMSAEQIWDSVVALALPEADLYRPRVTKQVQGIEKQRLIYESLEGRPEDEFFAMIEELAPAVEEMDRKVEDYRVALADARASGDERQFRKLRAEFAEVSKAGKKMISDVGYVHLDQQREDSILLATAGLEPVDIDSLEGLSESEKKGKALLELPAVVPTAADVQTARSETTAKRKKNSSKDARQRQRNSSRRKTLRGDNDFAQYRSLVDKMARASELASPAPRGHFLRDFGQSDREMIDNAADSASVPQALNLLNGPIVEALTNRYAVFGSRLHDAGSVEDKTKLIFQAMLSREPTADEIALVGAEVGKSGDAAYEGIVWSLLNTQQFLFVQ